jgi:hypothetical protein
MASSLLVLHVKNQDEQVNVQVPMISLRRERREGVCKAQSALLGDANLSFQLCRIP